MIGGNPMKKSEIYHLAQIAVVNSPCIAPENKLEIIRVLFADESLAKYGEEREKAAGKE
jgi:hypothetical protein